MEEDEKPFPHLHPFRSEQASALSKGIFLIPIAASVAEML